MTDVCDETCRKPIRPWAFTILAFTVVARGQWAPLAKPTVTSRNGHASSLDAVPATDQSTNESRGSLAETVAAASAARSSVRVSA
jgi:hypothetical protein